MADLADRIAKRIVDNMQFRNLIQQHVPYGPRCGEIQAELRRSAVSCAGTIIRKMMERERVRSG